MVLREAVPFVGTVPEGEYLFFDFAMASLDRAIDISITSISGDADVYASFAYSQPTNTIASDHPIWFSRRGGEAERDTLHIVAADPAFCMDGECPAYPSSLPATLHIGVHAFGEDAEFTLLATSSASAVESAIRLSAGLPQAGSLVKDEVTPHPDRLAHLRPTPLRLADPLQPSLTLASAHAR